MTLSYGKESPKDMLDKAQRDLSRLEAAEKAQSMTEVSDALFDFAVCLTAIKDWLKQHPNKSYSPQAVEDFAKSTALNTFREVANAGKHRILRGPEPKTKTIFTSAQSVFVLERESAQSSGPSSPRLKIMLADASRHRAVELGHIAVEEWRLFMCEHGVT